MEIFRFDRAERAIEQFGSVGASATRVAAGRESVHLACLTIEPGGIIGAHPAPVTQLFLVVAGEGWVAGPHGVRVPISAGSGVRWEPGEDHAAGSGTGLTALAVEGTALDLYVPQPVRGPA